jgi:hypothetical protein
MILNEIVKIYKNLTLVKFTFKNRLRFKLPPKNLSEPSARQILVVYLSRSNEAFGWNKALDEMKPKPQKMFGFSGFCLGPNFWTTFNSFDELDNSYHLWK